MLANVRTVVDLNKKHSSRPHNATLASAFFKRGLIEAWGRGTLKIIYECKKAGLPEPAIEINSGGISVTIYKKKKDENHPEHLDLNDRQIIAVEYVKLHGRNTNKENQKINNISREKATIDLRRLVKLGILKSSGTKGAGAFYELS